MSVFCQSFIMLTEENINEKCNCLVFFILVVMHDHLCTTPFGICTKITILFKNKIK